MPSCFFQAVFELSLPGWRHEVTDQKHSFYMYLLLKFTFNKTLNIIAAWLIGNRVGGTEMN